jgi:hypothetical protein
MALPGELELDAVVDETLPLQPVACTGVDEEVDDALLQHAGTDARLDVLAAAVFQDDRVDALAVQQVAEREPGRACTDDADLRSDAAQAAPSSSSTRCAIAKAPFAAGTPQ